MRKILHFILPALVATNLSAAAPARPNILFIMADDHAWQAVSAYGEKRHLIQTPNIDRLAREGMRFDHCMVCNSLCGPARASIITGTYSHINGFYNNSNSRFDGSQITFPKLLQAAGYQTAVIGKWHLESDPTGFDHWEILPGQGIYYNPGMIRDGVKVKHQGYVTEIITDLSLDWLRRRDPSKPFMLLCWHKAPHRIWEPALTDLDFDHDRKYPLPDSLHDDYSGRGKAEHDQDMMIKSTMQLGADCKLTPPPDLSPEQRKTWDAYYEPRNAAFRKLNLSGDALTEWKYNRYMHDYLGCIKGVDDNVGRLLKYLDDTGLATNTIVLYSSDQGFFLGEHGWFDKRWIFEESARTPLVMRWPGMIKPGSVCDKIISSIDFAETFLEAAGQPIPGRMQGRSLMPVLAGEAPPDWRTAFYYHYYEYPQPHHVRPHYGIITDRYTLAHFYWPDVDYWELFDRAKDPGEMTSVFGDPAYAQVQSNLLAEVARQRQELKEPAQDDPKSYGRPPKGAPISAESAPFDDSGRMNAIKPHYHGRAFKMKRQLFPVLILTAALLWRDAAGKIITVDTTNNLSPPAGETNLVQAINLLQDGDCIHFALPGNGPFYLITPPQSPGNGYPAITNNNVTIDGYSQPGALPNTNTILGSNTAQIQIVLDSRAGGYRVEDIPGLSLEEASVLLVKSATNVTIRGLSFLGSGMGSGAEADPATYAISFALGSTNGRVNGCWFGVAPDRTNVFRFQDAVTAFQGNGESFGNGIVIGVEKNAPDAATARGQFNVIVGEYIPLGLEGHDQRISGNFFNVFPDGVTDYNVNGIGDHNLQAFIEIGRRGDNLVIGADGDGNNDADERNIFGGVTLCDDFNLLEWYGCISSNTVIAGNYFGVGVDGVTRFTNSMTLLGGLHSSATVRFGSDFDGVSDDVEGNVISMSYPFNALFPSPASESVPDFYVGEYGAAVSFRGNVILGAQLAPFTYADGFGDDLPKLAAYCSNYFSAPYFPAIATNSTSALLKGAVPPGVAPCTNVVVDVYLADDEAWTNGEQFQFAELAYTDPQTSQTEYYGFAEGKTWLGAFDVNGPQNISSTPGQFAFDIRALNIPANALVTITASYTTNAIGAHNPVMHTSPFSLPAMLPIVPRLAIALTGTNVFLTWPTNAGSYAIQSTPALNPAAWNDLTPQPALQITGANYQAKLPFGGFTGFFRLAR